LNSLNLDQHDQVGEDLAKTVIHDKNFIHVLIGLPLPSSATLPYQRLVHLKLGPKLSPKATQDRF
jgi:hypothetical protein